MSRGSLWEAVGPKSEQLEFYVTSCSRSSFMSAPHVANMLTVSHDAVRQQLAFNISKMSIKLV